MIQTIFVKENTNKYLVVALVFGIMFHGSSVFFTLENSYDALIHLFFGNHYANSWFEPWNYSWYTGFSVMGYPPLVHQAIAALSFIGGLKFGLFTVAIIGVLLFITGVFKYTVLITGNRNIAGYAAIVAVLSSSLIETLHVFGQLPSIIGISVLMHALPEIYWYIKTGTKSYFYKSISLIAVTVCSHHVTPLFGMVFFISPLIGMVVMDASREQVKSYAEISFDLFFQTFRSLLKRIVLLCVSAVALIVFCIFPYWVNSKANPITQVSIPHGSRDNFLEVASSGLMFFLIPWGVLLFLLPYIFYRYYSKRYLFFGISITLLTVLGTGGTTFIPKLLLGENAFNILTLDRFTLWATVMSLPIVGEFVYRLMEGDLKNALQHRFGTVYQRFLVGLFAVSFLFLSAFTITIGYFKPLQPDKINLLPIVNFLNQDQHDQWRYLPLGFGDQMAFLSTQTKAMTVDGNYHSARRLPELTTRAVERLENAKYRGVEGLGSLQQFLTVPEKYNLKYVFSNDKFYDPILYFCGWHRLTQLENGIMVWEKLNVQPLSTILPKDEVHLILKLMWGIIPLMTVVLAIILNIQLNWLQHLKSKVITQPTFRNYDLLYLNFKSGLIKVLHLWTAIMIVVIGTGILLIYLKKTPQISPENVVKTYYYALDYKFYEKAFALVVPDKTYPLSQFMLELSVTDGILNSYGKLDAIVLSTSEISKSKARITAKTTWITPLEVIEKTYIHDVQLVSGKWYIVPQKLDTDLPPNQFIATNTTSFYNQGRRKISTQQTYHEDVLRQPDLEITKANLIYFDNQYMIVGTVQNIDNVPADVVMKATLYDKYNNIVASHNAKFATKHKLMPKETTSFKVNFEGIAWLITNDAKPSKFNPKEFTATNYKSKPVSFSIQSAGNVTISELYSSVAISELVVSKAGIKGTLFNHGIQEVTVPALLISYYNEKKQLIYVDNQFVKEGVRIQRKQYFNYSFLNLLRLKSIKYGTANCFVNGIPNEALARTVIQNRKIEEEEEQLQQVNGKGFSYIKVELNNFIGSPK